MFWLSLDAFLTRIRPHRQGLSLLLDAAVVALAWQATHLFRHAADRVPCGGVQAYAADGGGEHLSLAVIHHLAIHNGVRLDEVVREMAGTSRHLIIEFVAAGDLADERAKD